MFAELARRSLNQIQPFTSKIFSTLYTGAYFFLLFIYNPYASHTTTFFTMSMELVLQYFFPAKSNDIVIH
jgi:hypothetical protein